LYFEVRGIHRKLQNLWWEFASPCLVKLSPVCYIQSRSGHESLFCSRLT
jgi:hypothetical protein